MKLGRKSLKTVSVLLGALLVTAGFSACETGETRKYEAHIWAQEWETVVEPTCTEAGEARRFCSHCNDYKTKTIAPLGHALEVYHGKAATCTQKGWEAYESCVREGCEHTTYREIGKLAHEYENGACVLCGVSEPTAGLVYELNDGGGYSVTGIGDCEETEIVIAAEYQGLAVTEIAASAFEDCQQLLQVHISENIRSIGENAFKSCKKLVEINIPSSVEKIGLNAFERCFDLEILKIEDVGAWCGITFENVKNTESGADNSYCYANPLYYAKGFYTDGALVKSLIVPDSVEKINAYAFYHCYKLTSATISAKVEVIGERAFYDCQNLKSVTFGNGLKSLEKQAFDACRKLERLVFPDSVESIGAYAFRRCETLTSATLGTGLTTLGESAFQDCSALSFLEYEGGRYLGTFNNPYFALVEWSVEEPSASLLHADVQVLFTGALPE